MDIYTGIFTAPYSGVFEFMFQGFKVSVFPLFFQFISIEKNSVLSSIKPKILRL